MESKTMKTKLSDRVINGKLPNIRDQLAELLRKHEGEWVNLEFSTGDKRSNPQNRFYWGVIIPQFQHGFEELFGHKLSKDETHEALKERSMTLKRVLENSGKILSFNRSTADLDTLEFSEYVQELDEFALEFLGYRLNLPEH